MATETLQEGWTIFFVLLVSMTHGSSIFCTILYPANSKARICKVLQRAGARPFRSLISLNCFFDYVTVPALPKSFMSVSLNIVVIIAIRLKLVPLVRSMRWYRWTKSSAQVVSWTQFSRKRKLGQCRSLNWGIVLKLSCRNILKLAVNFAHSWLWTRCSTRIPSANCHEQYFLGHLLMWLLYCRQILKYVEWDASSTKGSANQENVSIAADCWAVYRSRD